MAEREQSSEEKRAAVTAAPQAVHPDQLAYFVWVASAAGMPIHDTQLLTFEVSDG